MLTNQAQPTPIMFCHDSTNIYYPTAPGRVYIIAITALADCDGSDEDYSDSTSQGDVGDLLPTSTSASLKRADVTPAAWPWDGDGTFFDDGEVTERDSNFQDALEQWADWCDRDSVRLDSLDEIKAAIARAA